MDLLEEIAKAINFSTFSWLDVASQIGIDVNDINKIKKKNNNTLEFVKTITNKIWVDIFSYVNISSNIDKKLQIEITNVCTVGKILAGDIVREDSITSEIDVVKEIACRISEWKLFGRILNLKEAEISQIEENSQLIKHRNLEIMRKFSEPTKPSTSWSFWREYLNQFDDGKAVISEMEMTFFDLLNQESSTEAHGFHKDNLVYFGHPFYCKNLNALDKNQQNKRLAVPVGSAEYQFVDYQELTEWVQTQKRYVDTYDILKDLKVINLVESIGDSCPILNTLNKHLETVDDKGFAAKGYHFIKHVSLFKSGLFRRNVFDEHYFCLFSADNIVLYITKDTSGVTDALQQSTQNIEAANLLHEKLQTYNFTQINVITYSKSPSTGYCKTCFDNQFYVDENIFANYDKFLSWYNEVKKKIRKNSPKVEDNIFQNIKKDMITYEALESFTLPSFSNCSDDQMDELRKLVLLTPTQYKVLHLQEKHILLRGSYGSGKSLVLLKKFESIINKVDKADVVYLLCNDPSSKYHLYMEQYRNRFNSQNLIIGNTYSLLQLNHYIVPKLSLVLNHIRNVWKEKTVHVFIDEFDGSYITKDEISQLENILKHFNNSYIVISIQSMREHVVKNKTSRELDIGYQYELLKDKTGFLYFDLEFSLRCSLEISKFIKSTSEVFESTPVSVNYIGNFGCYGKIVDKEYGREVGLDGKKKIKLKYVYNQTDVIGHNVSVSPVKVYCFHPQKEHSIIEKVLVIYTLTLSILLEDVSETKRYVICYFEENYGNAARLYLDCVYSNKWTDNVMKFIRPDSVYQILITNYASVRGYEFSNFIVLLPFGKKYLKYRNIECFSRATSNLHVVIIHPGTAISSSFKNRFSKKQNDDFVDFQTVQKWRELNCVEFFDCKYDANNDVLQMWKGESLFKQIEQTKQIAKFCEFVTKGLPKEVKKIHEDQDQLGTSDFETGVKYIMETDNVNLFREFVKTNGIDVINTFCYSDGNNILHIAIKCEATEIAFWILENVGIDINSLNYNEERPIDLAIKHQNVEIVMILIEAGVDVNLKNSVNDTLLHMAIRRGNLDISAILVMNGADVNAINDAESTPFDEAPFHHRHGDILKVLCGYKLNFHEKSNYLIQVFLNAVDRGRVDIVKFFVDREIDVNITDKDNKTPLYIAMVNTDIYRGTSFEDSYKSHYKIVKLLLKNGADINIEVEANVTPLLWAKQRQYADIVELIANKKT